MNFFLWNAFPQLSLDMTYEANWTGAFYKHLIYDFGFWILMDFGGWDSKFWIRFGFAFGVAYLEVRMGTAVASAVASFPKGRGFKKRGASGRAATEKKNGKHTTQHTWEHMSVCLIPTPLTLIMGGGGCPKIEISDVPTSELTIFWRPPL